MKVPSLGEVREHFKDAKVVKCLVDGNHFDLTNEFLLKKNEECYYFIDVEEVQIIVFHLNGDKGYAKIIEYKEKEIEYFDTILTGGIKVVKDENYDLTSSSCSANKITLTLEKIEKELPNSWEEYLNSFKYKQTESLGTIDRYIALRKLELLRDCYNDGWVANWNDIGYKHCLEFYEGSTCKYTFDNNQAFLNFKTAELRDKFLKNFSEIINIAKPLL